MTGPGDDHPQLRAIVFDLDGVIRHYDRAHEADIERRYGFEAGTLLARAFGGALGQDLMCGRIDVETFAVQFGEEIGSPGAARELVAMEAELDHEMVALVSVLRGDLMVGLLTNGSHNTRAELHAHGLAEAFDHVFNSADIGVAKPSPDVYGHVERVLGCAAAEVLFIDDKHDNVVGARSVGWHGHHFADLDTLRAELVARGVML